MIRVLIIENELAIAQTLHVFLSQSSIIVDHAYDGLEALERIQSDHYDAILLDLGLPKIDGVEVLRRLRQEMHNDVPILVISARVSEHDKINALELGADDYLTKPFSMAELVARINSHVQRAQGRRVLQALTYEGLCFYPQDQSISIRQQMVHLPPKALKLLHILLQHAEQTVSKAQLEHALWPDGEIDPYGLRGQIHILRKVLQSHHIDYLETVHGIGYRLKKPT